MTGPSRGDDDKRQFIFYVQVPSVRIVTITYFEFRIIKNLIFSLGLVTVNGPS